ncbi:hypothetical protein [Rossellomorea aquimaris]|uniref:hypothetical protein n=1 Tax=Rossellomorea aquimaris TaxID=189382 RepID=UPI0005CB348C|nr:hypothetical protein [Rossellomorea aquimaris]
MPNCYLFINEHILPRIFSSIYYDDFLIPCHNQSIFVSYQKHEKEHVTYSADQMQSAVYIDQTHVSQIIQSMMSSLNVKTTHQQTTERPTFDITLQNEDQPSLIISRISKPHRRKRRGKCPRLLSREVQSFERINYIDHNNSLHQSKYQANAPPVRHVHNNHSPNTRADKGKSKDDFIQKKLCQEKPSRKDIYQTEQKSYTKGHYDQSVNGKISHEEKTDNHKDHELKTKCPTGSLKSDVPNQTYTAGSFIENSKCDSNLIEKEEKLSSVLDNEILEDKKEVDLHSILEKDEVAKDIPSHSSIENGTDVIQPKNSNGKSDPYAAKENIPSKKILQENVKSKSPTDFNTLGTNPPAKEVKYHLNRTDVSPKKIVNEDDKKTAEFNFDILISNPPAKEVKYQLNRTDFRPKKIINEDMKKVAEFNFDILSSNPPAKEVRYHLKRTDFRPKKIINEDKKKVAEFNFDILISNPPAKEVKYCLNRTDFQPLKIVNEDKKKATRFNFDNLSSNQPAKEVKYHLNRTDFRPKKIVNEDKKKATEFHFDILSSNPPVKEVKYQLNRTDSLPKKIINEDKNTEVNFDILSSNPPAKELKKEVKCTEHSPKGIANEKISTTPTTEAQYEILYSKPTAKEVKYHLKRSNVKLNKLINEKTKITRSPKDNNFEILSSHSRNVENQVKYSHKSKTTVKGDEKTTKELEFDTTSANNSSNQTKKERSYQTTNKKTGKRVPSTPHDMDKDDYSHTTILNKYFTLGDKINVYAGSKLLAQQGTFLTAGPDFFIWIDGDGFVRLQIISGGISIGQTARNK